MSPEGIGPDQEKRIESKRVPSGQPRDRSRPSRLKPARSATRCDDTFSGCARSSMRSIPSSSNAQRATSRTARVAKPRPRADARRKYDAFAI
jgi:hypothetical protein